MTAHPKPTPRRVTQARARRRKALARAACVAAVWANAGSLCVAARSVCLPKEAAWFAAAGHVHERRSRAQGGDPTDPENCLLLCHACHFSGPSGAHIGGQR